MAENSTVSGVSSWKEYTGLFGDWNASRPTTEASLFSSSLRNGTVVSVNGEESAVDVMSQALQAQNGSNETSGVTVPVTEEPFLPWNNPENVISLATFIMIEKVCICGIDPALFLIGVPTNIINAIVFVRQGLKDRMNLLLFTLALCDMFFVALFFLIGSYCLVGHFRPDLETWWKFFARKYFTGLYRGFLYTSGCLTMIIAMERCLVVALPFKAARLVKTRTIAMVIVAIFIVIQAACCIYPLELAIGTMSDPDTGDTIFYLTMTSFYFDNMLLISIVENTFLMIVIPFTTFIVVTVATAITVVKLNKAITWRDGTGSESSISHRQRALAKMLVMVSCVYIFTAAPNVALGLSRLTVPGFLPSARFANIFLASHLIYLILAMFNSSVNFFIYVTRSSRYRQELRRLFLCQAAAADKLTTSKPPPPSSTQGAK